jgi:GNAT superfamily N-acetyltransferase
MAAGYQIHRMHADEVQTAINWAAQEGWNPGIHDAQTFYAADPDGFFVGEINNEAIAVGSAVVYDEHFAFCGLYIVKPEYRGKGYGIELTQARLQYAKPRNVGIDGVVENISIYERIGYRLAYHNVRFQGIAVNIDIDSKAITPLSNVLFSDIETYDRQCFPAYRSKFLRAWITQADSLALGFVENGRLLGYGVRRRCIEGHKIGPLFADNPRIADQLFLALQQDIPSDAIFLDIAEINPAAEKLVLSHNMEPVFSTGRMYLQGKPELAYEKLFGITTFELG